MYVQYIFTMSQHILINYCKKWKVSGTFLATPDNMTAKIEMQLLYGLLPFSSRDPEGGCLRLALEHILTVRNYLTDSDIWNHDRYISNVRSLCFCQALLSKVALFFCQMASLACKVQLLLQFYTHAETSFVLSSVSLSSSYILTTFQEEMVHAQESRAGGKFSTSYYQPHLLIVQQARATDSQIVVWLNDLHDMESKT